MRQFRGNRQVLFAALAGNNGAPTLAGDGIAIADFPGIATSSYATVPGKEYLLKHSMTGAGAISEDLYLWVLLDGATDWGPAGEADGQMNATASVTGNLARIFYQNLLNLGNVERVYLEVRAAVGAPTASAWLYQSHEKGD